MHRLRDRVDSIYAPPLDKDHVMHTKDPSAMQKTLAMIFDLEKEIDQQTCELIGKKQETLCLLDQMHAENAHILSGYYLEGQSTKELGKTMFLSRRQVQRRLKEALREFQMLLSQRVSRSDSSHPEG